MTKVLTRPTPSGDGSGAAQPPRRVHHLDPVERAALGKAERKNLPLADLAALSRDPGRTDPVAMLEDQAATRVPELVPVRYGRMVVSPFTFYRGAARIMASDLAATPWTGLTVQLCGDAHLLNFGLFGSPERRLVFDINDFDETLPGPFEWDVKRLAASMVIAASDRGLTRKQTRSIVTACTSRYRTAIADFAAMRELDVWYSHVDADELAAQLRSQVDPKRHKKLVKALQQARTRDSTQALKKLTVQVDGVRHIAGDPPLIVPVRDLLPAGEGDDLEEGFRVLIRQYRRTLEPDRRVLLERYRFVDMARKVVGVGSVGTRCWIVLLTGRDAADPLFLQVKEANASVLAEHLPKSKYTNQGQRVVNGQRLMQQASDIFLGWQRTAGIDDVERDFYVRQLRDWKGSIEVEALLPQGLALYGELCATCLARAHARSGDAIAISAYLGSSETFDNAIADFAEAYAQLNERDHRALSNAVSRGDILAQPGM